MEKVRGLADLSGPGDQKSLRSRVIAVEIERRWLGGVSQSRGHRWFQRFLRRGNSPGEITQVAPSLIRRDHLHSERPGRDLGVDRSQPQRDLRVAGGQLFLDTDECLA